MNRAAAKSGYEPQIKTTLPGPKSRKVLERETLEGWEVNEILREETGVDHLKQKEYYPEQSPGEQMTIAPGTGPLTDISPVPAPAPSTERKA